MNIAGIGAGILIIVACFMIANGISESYSGRKKFLKEFIAFITFAQNEINFYNIEAEMVIEKFIAEKGESAFTETLTGKRRDKDVCEYMETLRKCDRSAQRNNSAIIQERIKRELAEVEAKEKNNSMSVKKIIPLVGVAILILLL